MFALSMFSQISFREFLFGSDAYHQECELRQQVLRRPLGLNLYDADLTGETAHLHFGLFDGNAILACVVAAPLSPTEVKLRQMAVHPGFQGQGLGRKLLELAEAELVKRGFENVFLHARMSAIGFYSKLAYQECGDEFLEIGIPHVKMQKSLTRAAASPA